MYLDTTPQEPARVAYSPAFLALDPDPTTLEARKARRGTVLLADGPAFLVAWDDDPASQDEPVRVLSHYITVLLHRPRAPRLGPIALASVASSYRTATRPQTTPTPQR